MPFDHKQHFINFVNSLVASGKVTQAKAQELLTLADSDAALLTALAEGNLAQSELNRQLDATRSLETQLRDNYGKWNNHIATVDATLRQSEQERLASERRAAAAETAIRALVSQYNIPEEEARQLYNAESYRANPNSNPNFNVNPNPQQPNQPRQPQQDLNAPQYVKAEDLYGLVKDIARKDELAARHFDLTGKPWNSSKALNYIEEQAKQGRPVSLEEAWRITESVDALEATALATAKTAERAALRTEIEAEMAAERNSLPNDPNPSFVDARISQVFEQDADGKPTEQAGHYGRTRAAQAALARLQDARRRGQPSPYDEQRVS
jgi:hypothetical protein